MASTPTGDPRLAPAGEPQGVAPVVALPRSGPSWIFIAIGMAILGVLLFSVLDSRRRAVTSPAVRTTASDRVGAAPPPLYVPPPPAPAPVVVQAPAPAPQVAAPPPEPRIIYVPQPAPAPVPIMQPPAAPPRATSDAALVYDGGSAAPAQSFGIPATPAGEGAAPASQASGGPSDSVAGARARSGVLANRATTVPQGTLIPAVLETGLDSTRPGLARAMVSRDVRGFDGKRILIPRGSRLIGEYRSEAQPGQKRALVNWIRLIRPDGVTMAIGSPASDPLGRGGMRASVNSHFFERFAGAILQSTLDIGVNLATTGLGGRNNPVILALPGTLQGSGAGQMTQGDKITPTLTVKPGTSITIFVARDLDFTGAENRR